MDTVSIVTEQLLIMAVLLAVGFFLFKIKFLPSVVNKGMTDVLLYVVNPCIAIACFNFEFDRQTLINFGIGIGLSAAIHAAAIIISHIFSIRSTGDQKNIERFAMIFTNCGFMSLPITTHVLGVKGGFYNSTYIIIFNIIVWTFGIMMLDKKTKRTPIQKLRKVLSPVVIAVIVGFIMYVCQLHFPSFIQKTIDSVAAMNTPLAMIISGAYLAQAGLFAAFKKARVWIVSVLNMVIMPTIFLFVCMALHLDRTLALALLVPTAAPAAAMLLFFTKDEEKRQKHAAHIFALTTIMSIVTIPVFVALGSRFL